ncbi:MAG: LVIVD repeat-containing protein [Actinomycetota bacterium]
MRRRIRWSTLAVSMTALVAVGVPAQADHATRPSTTNIHALGHSPQEGTFSVPDGQRVINSDIAFWGDIAFNGNYNGFRVIDISAPGNPKEISHPECNGDQGDIVVWEDILVRSWNSPAPAGRTCDGEPVPVGFEGVHVWDISDLDNPTLLTAVEFSAAGAAQRGTADGCGSHTATLVPDLESDRLLVYSNNSSGAGRPVCDAMDIIEVPTDDPSSASHIGYVPLTGGSLGSNNGCHDAGAILGDVNKLVCASGHAANVFSIGAPGGGTLENPQFLYTIEESDAFGNKVGIGGRWHSAGFTWDGEVIVLGWEPGGGGAAECEATDPDIKKSMFFYDADTGAKLGQWVLPNPQGADENCTIHVYNIVPLRSGRYVAVSGNYQAGTWATDFTDPANPVTVGWSDPPSLGPGPFCGGQCQIGGAWSSYWYNNFIYESEIQAGLNVFRLSDSATGGAIKLDHLNPQTQEFSL